MYYSKNSSASLSIPRNYGGSVFRVIDETEREKQHKSDQNSTKIDENFAKNDKNNAKNEQKSEVFSHFLQENCKKSSDFCEKEDEKTTNFSLISNLFDGILVEDLLLLGLIFVIHHENPNNPVLLLLLILLLSK